MNTGEIEFVCRTVHKSIQRWKGKWNSRTLEKSIFNCKEWLVLIWMRAMWKSTNNCVISINDMKNIIKRYRESRLGLIEKIAFFYKTKDHNY